MKMRLIGFLCLAWLLSMGGNIAVAHDIHGDLRHWEIASRDPDRIFLSFCGDPATSRAVTWRTDTRIVQAAAQIAKAIAHPSFSRAAVTVEATTETVNLNDVVDNTQGNVNYHSVVFDSLEPETLYAYRVGDANEVWSEWIQFRTAAVENAPFSFVYFGDAQVGILSHWSRVIRMAYQKAPDAAFAIHAGDLVNRANRDLEWAQWFKAGGWLHAQWTGVPVLGNHELWRPNEKLSSALQWRPQFTLPTEPQLPEELQETVYSFDYQGLRVIVLNSMVDTDAQTAYLEKQLKRPGARWKAVTCHYSIFSPAAGRDFAYARQAWKPLLDKYSVDLVLQGHDHTYARGHVPARTAEGNFGTSFQTMYVTSMSGAKMYRSSMEQLQSYAPEGYRPDVTATHKQFFQIITIAGNLLTYQAYTADGELYDHATITKDFQTGEKTLQ